MTSGVVRFAWVELLVSLRFWRRTSSPLQNDFIKLTFCFFFSFVMVSLGALIELNGISILERVLLGGVPGKGVPVYFRASSELKVTGLDSARLKAFKESKPGLDVYPYWQFDLLDATELQMPGRRAMSGANQTSSDSESSVLPRAMAISRHSPIWQDLVGVGSGGRDASHQGLEVIASKAAFRALDTKKIYGFYRASALMSAPFVCPLQHHLPATIERWEDLDTLLLAEPERNGKQAIHPFKVTWVDSFPTPQDYALIVPLEIFDLLKAIDNNNAVQVFFEGGSRDIQRVESAALHNVASDHQQGVAEFRTLARCMGAQHDPQSTWIETWTVGDACAPMDSVGKRPGETSNTLFLKLPSAMPKASFENCVERSGIRTVLKAAGRLDDFRPSLVRPPMSMVWRGPGDVRVCKLKPDEECLAGGSDKVNDQAVSLLGNTHAIVFVPTNLRSRPLEVVAMEIERWRLEDKEVFILDPASRATLIRFGVLTKFIGYFGNSFAWTALVAFSMFAGAFLGMMFDHRKTQYGVMMLHGISVRGIIFVAVLQTTAVLCLAAVCGFLAAYGMQWLLYLYLNDLDVVQEARRTIGLGTVRLQVPGISTLLGYVGLVVGAALVVLLALRLWSLRSVKSASQLLRQ